MSKFVPPGDCPVCGHPVPAGAVSCRECGACPNTGWNEDTRYDGLDLPEVEQDIKKPQLHSDHIYAPEGAKRLSPVTIIVVLILVATMLWFMFPI